jgi:hypothetical protein
MATDSLKGELTLVHIHAENIAAFIMLSDQSAITSTKKEQILVEPAGELGKTTQFGDPHRGNWPRKRPPQCA